MGSGYRRHARHQYPLWISWRRYSYRCGPLPQGRLGPSSRLPQEHPSAEEMGRSNPAWPTAVCLT